MSNRFIAIMIQGVSIVGTVITIIEFFSKVPTNENCLPFNMGVIFLLFLLIFVSFIFYKKNYRDIYDLLLVLSKNNKLHIVRELIMILDENNKVGLNHYKFRIYKSIHSYSILSSKKRGRGYDVEYKLEFILQLFLIEKIILIIRCIISKKCPSLYFYAICENAVPGSVHAEIEHRKIGNVKLEPVTFSGESNDKSEEFAGLYGCSNLTIPFDVLIKNKQIEIVVQYKVKHQIVNSAKQYTFAIFPQNYGRKIQKAEIFLSGQSYSNPILQRFSSYGFYTKEEKMSKFVKLKTSQYLGSFIPIKNCMYIVQIDLQKK